MNLHKLWLAVAAVAVLALEAGPVLASPDLTAPLPAPGILGLVAIGVAGAVAFAKWRK